MVLENLPEVTHQLEQSSEADDDVQLRYSTENVTELMRKFGVQGSPKVVCFYTLDVVRGEKWEPWKGLGSLGMAYDGPESYRKASGFLAAVREYHQNVKNNRFLTPDKELPFDLTKGPFLGIHGLRDYSDGSPQEILTVSGVLQFILILDKENAERNIKCIRAFSEAV